MLQIVVVLLGLRDLRNFSELRTGRSQAVSEQFGFGSAAPSAVGNPRFRLAEQAGDLGGESKVKTV